MWVRGWQEVSGERWRLLDIAANGEDDLFLIFIMLIMDGNLLDNLLKTPLISYYSSSLNCGMRF